MAKWGRKKWKIHGSGVQNREGWVIYSYNTGDLWKTNVVEEGWNGERSDSRPMYRDTKVFKTWNSGEIQEMRNGKSSWRHKRTTSRELYHYHENTKKVLWEERRTNCQLSSLNFILERRMRLWKFYAMYSFWGQRLSFIFPYLYHLL